MENLELFLQNIKKALDASVSGRTGGNYLNLASPEGTIDDTRLSAEEFPSDNLAAFQELVMKEIEKCHYDKIEIAVNELLKHLLIKLNGDNEDFLAGLYLKRLKMIFKRCLMPDFPFPDELWNYICACLRSTGGYLLDKGYFKAAREIIDFLAGMGRMAAVKCLPTSNTQSSLRILENKALELGQKQLASIAKNARFNLET